MAKKAAKKAAKKTARKTAGGARTGARKSTARKATKGARKTGARRPNAAFIAPVTPDDVIWTFETLRQKGEPFYRAYYADVTKVRAVGFSVAGSSSASGARRC